MLLPESLKLHDQSKFDFHYIYFLPWKDQMVQPIRSAGGRVNCIEAGNNFEMLLRYRKVISYCEKHDIQLIHCHLPWSGFLGRMVFRKTKIPMVYTEHNIQEHYHIATKWLNRSTFNNQTLAIGVSEDVSRSIRENISPRIPVKTIVNGVNTSFFSRKTSKGNLIRKKFSIPEEAPVVGTIAVFRAQKALLNWVRAFKVAHEQHQNLYGIIVGGGAYGTGYKKFSSRTRAV